MNIQKWLQRSHCTQEASVVKLVLPFAAVPPSGQTENRNRKFNPNTLGLFLLFKLKGFTVLESV